ncbi:GNAT family N-acetyltransferase [Streptomyces stelliscabiei]|uniref:GNAT family N-acetyltransferase n=1 Tax=Streptomyces stelliscabiei TaxID=146820 RepID=UPI0029BF2300|nr:GNAT family N-acetyltransferase [Streptomyces stelliscabiei]MDX2549814.1 GNAT family N-acetyltransferase [Streptomyces stelliscabiei]MDX2610765.1 GNAT family N-acetyltransferase [Streptomyces stelliscabiei]MDX2635145.1 GNAT family N-acetyltransferase [Streptomyces stelliscabiei]MDX2660952.1 GNAT family N-acetyltransferase [Streptomyces stelliscabiei]MDX2710284.1 GNAT family N-acetyltransferase [Streptomyces stelliscabiei]
MLVRALGQDDVARPAELTIDTFRPFFEDSVGSLLDGLVLAALHADWRDDYRALVPTLHDPAQDKYVAVAEADGVIAGYVAWRAGPTRRHGEITLLAVDAEHRGDRVGTALCEHAFADLRGRGTKLVEIGTGGDAFHAPARALYESLGCVLFPTAHYYRRL